MPQARSHWVVVRQLSDRLRVETARVIDRSSVESDSKLAEQIDEAVTAVRRHVSDAFAAERDRDSARSVRLARAAVSEVQEKFRAAVLKRLVGERALKEVREVLSMLYPALSALLAEYLTRGRAPMSPVSRP